MPGLTRTTLAATVVGACLLVVVVAALSFLVDANDHKARLEAAASEALGMEVSIGGRLGISFFPGVLLTLQDVHLRQRGKDLASAKSARLGIGLLPLLRQQLRIESVELDRATVFIERERDGHFNFERRQAAQASLPAFSVPSVSLKGAAVTYADKQFGDAFEARNCALALHQLQLPGGPRAALVKGLSFGSELACAELSRGGVTLSEVKASASMKEGVFDLKPVTARVFGAQGSGSLQASFAAAVPVYRLQYKAMQFPVEEFFKSMAVKKVAAGRMDVSTELSAQGSSMKELRQSLKGRISLRGKDLTLIGTDLDGVFSRFEASQNFSLVDVGAVFFAGPLGLAITKGVDFASVVQDAGGTGEIRTLVSEWKVERGVAQAQDVAMATKENRVALRGGLDFVNDQFNEVTLALVDAKGCAKVQQKIRGSFQNPIIEKPNLLTTLAGPALRLLKKGSDLVLGGQCDVFYAGSVAAPK